MAKAEKRYFSICLENGLLVSKNWMKKAIFFIHDIKWYWYGFGGNKCTFHISGVLFHIFGTLCQQNLLSSQEKAKNWIQCFRFAQVEAFQIETSGRKVFSKTLTLVNFCSC